MRTIRFFIVGLFLAASVFATGTSDSPAESGTAESVTLLLDWTPNTNHIGAYVAVAQGFFAEEGLQVTIEQPGQSGADALVAAGRAQFAFSYQEGVTFARSSEQPLPIVAVAAVIPGNSSGFAALASSSIENPGDLVGKRYGGWGSPVETATLDALLAPYGASSADVELVQLGAADFLSSLERDIDFAWIFEGWDGVYADLQGVELSYLPLADYDEALDYYTPVIVTSESLIAQDPDLVERFLRALEKGYRYAVENPDQAAEALLAAAPELDRDLVLASSRYVAERFLNQQGQWGTMEASVWEAYGQWLRGQDLLPGYFDAEGAFTNDFLSEAD